MGLYNHKKSSRKLTENNDYIEAKDDTIKSNGHSNSHGNRDTEKSLFSPEGRDRVSLKKIEAAQFDV